MSLHPDDPQALRRRRVNLNGLEWDMIDEGRGPLIILLHGFPYLAYAWRHIVPGLVQAGWRVLAPDLPGFGDSDCPADPARHMQLRLAKDLAALVHASGASSAVFVGHDVGASLAFTTALLHPEVVAATVILNTPVQPRAAVPPSESWLAMRQSTGGCFYQEYFASDKAIAELNADLRKTLRATMFSISGSAQRTQRWRSLIQPGESFLDTVHDPVKLPAWLSERALDHYVSAYRRHGFAGALMPYRSRELNWHASADLSGRVAAQPSLFIGGAADPAAERLGPALQSLDKTLPGLRGRVMLQGIGHSVPEEAPQAMLGHLTTFLEALACECPCPAPHAH